MEAIQKRFEGFRGILEIGPGPGVLTGALSSTCERMIALEVDQRMISALADSAPRAEVRLADALVADLASILQELPEPRGVVSNLPYYITGPLITRIAEASSFWSKAVLMMQKEVASRVLAPAGDRNRGSLSVYLQAQFQIEKVIDAPAGAFLPPPKVDSTVLEFVPIGTSFEPAFFEFVRAAFKQPRKTLANNLFATGLSREEVAARLQAADLDERVRPHALTLAEWQQVFTHNSVC